MRLRVFLAPCGIGLGHITRTHPIAVELNKRGNTTVFSTYLEGLDYAKRNGLPTYEALPINFKVTNEGAIDFKKTAATSGFSLGIRMFLRQVVREIQFLKQFKPDVILSDSRASTLIAGRLLRIPVALMLNQFRVEIIRRPSAGRLTVFDRLFFFIANVGWLFIRTAIQLVWGRSQFILIPDLPAPYTISIGNLAIPKRYDGKVKLIGPIVNQTDETHYDQSYPRNALGFTTTRPFIYAAVSGPKVEREVLCDLLVDAFEGMSAEFQIALSRGTPEGRRPERLVNGIRMFDWIENQDDFIRASDLVVSRAGHGTIMKSLVYGKSMILIPIPDHTEQYGNARRAAALHVAEVIDQNVLNHDTLQANTKKILADPTYAQTSARIGREAASLHAITKACEVIENLGRRH
jgi:UDP:flavonoid glycosyltransferase YjiC (YdhE family)